MKPPVRMLIVVATDPRESPRAAEAVRMAAGVGAWKQVAIDLYLHGPATHCLSELCEDWREGQLLKEHLPAIVEHGGRIFYEDSEDCPPSAQRERALANAATPLGVAALAASLPGYDRVMRF
jgi:hypothetical protein